jgi:hypothetical protein
MTKAEVEELSRAYIVGSAPVLAELVRTESDGRVHYIILSTTT